MKTPVLETGTAGSAATVPTPTSPATAPIKTTVNLPPDSMNALKELAAERGTSVADVIRRAIWIEKYLHDAIKSGSKILVQESDKTVRELVIR